MSSRTLGILSALVWLTACGCTFALTYDLQRPEGARAALWTVWALDLLAAFVLTFGLQDRAVMAEADASNWRGRWGSEVGPYRLALARIVWAVEEATQGSDGRPVRVEAPDLLVRANRLADATRAVSPSTPTRVARWG